MQNLSIMDDGIELRAILERPDQERRPLVIVLHGFTSSKDRAHTVAACEAMREAGFATLRFDLYGHGESGGEFRNHTLYKSGSPTRWPCWITPGRWILLRISICPAILRAD